MYAYLGTTYKQLYANNNNDFSRILSNKKVLLFEFVKMSCLGDLYHFMNVLHNHFSQTTVAIYEIPFTLIIKRIHNENTN